MKPWMRESLASPPERGYPEDYLLSRIRGRRALLLRDWQAVTAARGSGGVFSTVLFRGPVDETPRELLWRRLAAEYAWVYSRMNEDLRGRFAPFFFHAEIRTISICLRYLSAGRTDAVARSLSSSLLSAPLAEALTKAAGLTDALARIERITSGMDRAFSGLEQAGVAAGVRAAERFLAERFLSAAADHAPDHEMRDFFRRLIDARNLLSLIRHGRLRDTVFPELLTGGFVRHSVLRRLAADPVGLRTFVSGAAGTDLESAGMHGTERALYASLTRAVQRSGRYPLGIGPVLDYLWRCSIEAMNLGIIAYAGQSVGGSRGPGVIA